MDEDDSVLIYVSRQFDALKQVTVPHGMTGAGSNRGELTELTNRAIHSAGVHTLHHHILDHDTDFPAER